MYEGTLTANSYNYGNIIILEVKLIHTSFYLKYGLNINNILSVINLIVNVILDTAKEFYVSAKYMYTAT
jgi:hypothetical protein